MKYKRLDMKTIHEEFGFPVGYSDHTEGIEIPMIAVMAAFADGTTVIRDAQELKVKESDRITVMVENLKRMGADIEGTDDGMIIHGGKPLHGATIDSHLDHSSDVFCCCRNDL